MSTFSKIYGLAGAAIVFAGMAFGQATCVGGAPATNIIRVEGTTELLAPTTFTCTATAPATAAAGTLNLQVFLSPALPITSKAVNSTSTEAVAAIGGTSVLGTVSGSTILFSGLASPALTAGQNFIVTVSNIRVNATSLNVGSGVPPAISETAFVNGSAGSIVPTALTFTNVAFAQAGLAPAKTYKSITGTTPFGQVVVNAAGAASYVVCNGYNPKADGIGSANTVTAGNKSLAFVVQVNEGSAFAFKTLADEASTTAVVTGTGNTANSGTRIKLAFANVPANVTLLVPTGPIGSSALSAGNAQITLTSSEAGAIGAVTASGAASVNGAALAAVTISGGSGSAVFEVTQDDQNHFDSFNIPVFVSTASNTVAGSSTAITTTVSLAPTASTNVPNFTSGASSTTLTGSTFGLCTTSLLFPFVTNQLGFDTGIAIANTSTDPFSTTGQAGPCTLNFYGAGAPTPSSITTATVPSGTVFTQVLSGVAAGFQGYMIAQCGFQYAHGFAFITDGVGVNGGLSQGYLAGVIPDVSVGVRGANTTAGTGEILGN